MAAISTYLANKLLDLTFRGTAYTPPATVYFGIFTTLPTTGGAGGVEVTGGSYARESMAFANATILNTRKNSAEESLPSPTADWGDGVGWGIWDASSAGNLLFFGSTPEKTIIEADLVKAVIDSIRVAFSTNISYYLANKWLLHVLANTAYTAPATIYMGLHSVTPTAAGGGTEFSAGAYARESIAFGAAAAGRQISNTAVEDFGIALADQGTAEGFGLYDASSSGNLLVFNDLETPKVVNATQVFRVAIGAIIISID